MCVLQFLWVRENSRFIDREVERKRRSRGGEEGWRGDREERDRY